MIRTRKITPAHQILASLAALLTLAIYGSAVTAPAFADPSAATQQFFGFSSGGGGSTSAPPASCDISVIQAKVKAINDQITQLNNDSQAQLKKLQDEMSSVKQGDMDTVNKLQQEQDQLLKDTTAQLQALKDKEEVYHKESQGPSDQCKKDLVAHSVAELQSLVAAMNGGALSKTLDKVDSVTAEIEGLESKLSSAGVNASDIATIKKDVAAVKSDNQTLRGFFAAMKAQAASFIAAANADPVGMYAKLNSGARSLDPGTANAASSAADNLVSSFTSMVNLFDKITNTAGGQ